MWLVAILLAPLSWIGALLCWLDWQHFRDTGQEMGEPFYYNPVGWVSMAYVALQLFLLVAWLLGPKK
jgi:hypothetical protein